MSSVESWDDYQTDVPLSKLISSRSAANIAKTIVDSALDEEMHSDSQDRERIKSMQVFVMKRTGYIVNIDRAIGLRTERPTEIV